jgi:uncharacterized protein
MNAANASLQASSLENERRAHEPSMEEILASIRKIIADDDALPLTRPVAEPRSTFATPKPFDKPFDKPFEATFDRPFESNVTPLATRPSFAADEFEPLDEPTPIAIEERETASVASMAPEAAIDEASATPGAFDFLNETAAPPAAMPAVAVDQEPAFALDLDIDAVAFGSTVLRHSPEEDDLASLAEIASELSAHDLMPAIADEPPEEILAEMRVEEFADEQPTVVPPPIPETNGATSGDSAAMMSPETDATVASAFRALSASVQLASAETIDRQVRELLRPMLKQWLDDNLPVMVERLVRAEIERVARGGR